MMIGSRLLEARRRAGLLQIDLAVALGRRYDPSMVSQIENGRKSIRLEGASDAARELGVSLDYLVGLTEDSTPAAELSEMVHAQLDSSGIAKGRGPHVGEAHSVQQLVDIIEVAAAAGSGAEVWDETPVGRLSFERKWLRRHAINAAQCKLITARGESMEPTLPDGCSIMVDKSRRTPRDQRVYVVRTGEGLVVKRVRKNSQGWWLMSDNPAWPPLVMGEDTEIIGEVRWVARAL